MTRTRFHDHTPTDWQHVDSITLRAHIARELVGAEPDVTLGDITLLPHQRDALARLRTTIREFHGALLADEVGLGKTFVALALARDYQHTIVVAPATLLPMWRQAIARTTSHALELQSLHSYSRTRAPLRQRRSHSASRSTHSSGIPSSSANRRTLVVVDEAHHLRTHRTRRYRAIAQLVAGKDLLLLSATPLHNNSTELRHLLALFAGHRTDLLDPQQLARLIIRHTAVDAHQHTISTATPRVHEHPPLEFPADRALLDAILALPAPLPARDGAVAGALIRIGLLRAWCSSNAALAHVIRRRLLRGEALQQSLEAGRHPTNAELRTWIVGDHEVQLAFPELLAQHTPDNAPLLTILAAHLDALQALLRLPQLRVTGHSHDVSRDSSPDAARALALRRIVAAHPETPVIAFSQFTRTVDSLYRALSDIAGVGALTGMHGRIASGRIGRLETLSRFAPIAQERPPPPAHQRIRLLLTTDILAEGVNLQDAGVVVHLDLPWTDALRRQREGRIARIGSPHRVVHVYRFAPPPDADRALQLSNRLLQKAQLARRLVGRHESADSPAPTNTGNAVHSPADLAARLQTRIRAWLALAPPSSVARAFDAIPVAAACADRTGWIALVRHGDVQQLVVRTSRTTSDDLAAVWRVVSSLSESASPPSPARASPVHLARVQRQLASWCADVDMHHSLGLTATGCSRAQQLALQRLAQALAEVGPQQRWSLATGARVAERLILAAQGVAAQDALSQWATAPCSRAPDQAQWIRGWRDWPALQRLHDALAVDSSSAHSSVEGSDAVGPRFVHSATTRERRADSANDAPSPQLVALLLLVKHPGAG